MENNHAGMDGITLNRMLAARDERMRVQTQKLSKYPGTTLMMVTVVMPGMLKRTPESETAARAACRALRDRLGDKIVNVEERDLLTGFEAYLMVDMEPMEAKALACDIENTHPLGRIFDIDVLDREGNHISRKRLGLEGRKCLLCDEDARVCMRRQTHSYEELLAHINKLARDYDGPI